MFESSFEGESSITVFLSQLIKLSGTISMRIFVSVLESSYAEGSSLTVFSYSFLNKIFSS